jgi:hypothetical protein
MDIARFFYKLHLLDDRGLPVRFIGTAFPISPAGGLLTCRHVVDIAIPERNCLGVLDSEHNRFVPLPSHPVFPADAAVDLAFLPNAFARPKAEFFPMLTGETLTIGFDVYTFGFFAIGAHQAEIEQGYFAGRIVNFFNHEKSPRMACLTLPFPILEGMSGCPILTYHNGPKLVGVGIGNRQSRILASETIEVEEGSTRFRESINRIVEYGVAYHAVAVQHFLAEASIPCSVSNDRVAIPNLE